MKKNKLPPSMRGKYVSRAAFAKMQGERDRALKDIYALVMNQNIADVILLKNKWKAKFEKDRWFTDALKEIARQELPKLKEKYGIKDITDAKLDSNPKAFK